MATAVPDPNLCSHQNTFLSRRVFRDFIFEHEMNEKFIDQFGSFVYLIVDPFIKLMWEITLIIKLRRKNIHKKQQMDAFQKKYSTLFDEIKDQDTKKDTRLFLFWFAYELHVRGNDSENKYASTEDNNVIESIILGDSSLEPATELVQKTTTERKIPSLSFGVQYNLTDALENNKMKHVGPRRFNITTFHWPFHRIFGQENDEGNIICFECSNIKGNFGEQEYRYGRMEPEDDWKFKSHSYDVFLECKKIKYGYVWSKGFRDNDELEMVSNLQDKLLKQSPHSSLNCYGLYDLDILFELLRIHPDLCQGVIDLKMYSTLFINMYIHIIKNTYDDGKEKKALKFAKETLPRYYTYRNFEKTMDYEKGVAVYAFATSHPYLTIKEGVDQLCCDFINRFVKDVHLLDPLSKWYFEWYGISNCAKAIPALFKIYTKYMQLSKDHATFEILRAFFAFLTNCINRSNGNIFVEEELVNTTEWKYIVPFAKNLLKCSGSKIEVLQKGVSQCQTRHFHVFSCAYGTDMWDHVKKHVL